MPEIIELGFMDLNPFIESMTVSHGVVFSGAFEVGKIERAWAKLGETWPILGAYVRHNEESDKIELVIPDAPDRKLKVTSKVLNQTLEETESFHVRTATITTQICVRTEMLYRDGPQKNLQQHIATGDPVFALHTGYLADATFITITFPHLVDGCGYHALIMSLLSALDDQPIPPLLTHDPWAVILLEALQTPTDPEAVRSMSTWDKSAAAILQHEMEVGYRANEPIQMRTIYFPAAEIEKMKLDAMEDLKRANLEVPWLSTTDLIGAWMYKYALEDGPNDESKSRFVYPFNARAQFPEAFTPGQVYLRNAFFTVTTDQLTDAQLHAMSLGEIARVIRMSVIGSSTRVSFLSKMRCHYEHAGEFYVPFSPGDRLRVGFLGLSFKLGEMNVAQHIKPGTGTGETLDVTGEAIGRHYVTLIKYKDAEGGVVCEMDWGAKRWTSGPIAKFALENQC
ncbi:hypothetical protein RhiJN_01507 [Ceratobasidium sp. AG-Ba]|nr:hypothetical protein RhiJN_01507 [Ceratobasidium sp. AG-Ba]